MSGRTAFLRSKLEEDPDNLLHLFSLGKNLLEEENYTEAESWLRRCTELRADWMVARILLGRCLAEEGKAGEAKDFLREAVRLAREQGHDGPEAECLALLEELEEP